MPVRTPAYDSAGQVICQEKANTTMLTGMGASMHVTTARELIVTLRHLHDHPNRSRHYSLTAKCCAVHAQPRISPSQPWNLQASPKSANEPSAASTGAKNQRISASVLKSAVAQAAHTYHSMLKHSRFASLAAKLRVERYVWRPAPQLQVHSSRYIGYSSKAAKVNSNTSNPSNPMRQRGCLFVASGY